MKIKNHIVRKFDDSYVVWIEEYNQWIHLEEPAYLVFEEVFGNGGYGVTGLRGYGGESGEGKRGRGDEGKRGRGEESDGGYGGDRGDRGEEIGVVVGKLMKRYGLGEEEAKRFVIEIIEVLEGLKKVEEDKLEIENLVEDETDEDKIIHTYKANDVVVRFEFATEILEYYNHHSFAHMEIEIGNEKEADAVFRVFDSGGKHVLKQIKPVEQEWTDTEIPGLKRRILIEFGNVIYKKDISEWMSIIHGAIITNRKNAMMLSSASGSGKSTFAALMQKEGYELASDDYVPLDGETALIYPFPAAFSVKAGSFELLSKFYPELRTTPEKKFRLTNKSLRFLPPVHHKNFNYSPFPATHLVFVKYNPKIKYKLEPLTIPEAMKLFTEEAWISGNPVYAERFIEWFSGLKCYSLEYSDSERVVEEIGELLGEVRPDGSCKL